jgi:hypothetical protein
MKIMVIEMPKRESAGGPGAGKVIPINRSAVPFVDLKPHQERRVFYLLDVGRAARAVEEGLAHWE